MVTVLKLLFIPLHCKIESNKSLFHIHLSKIKMHYIVPSIYIIIVDLILMNGKNVWYLFAGKQHSTEDTTSEISGKF